MEVLGVGRGRARPQHGGEPAAGGLSHCPREQGFCGIRFMADCDTSPIGEGDCGKIDGDALGMRVWIAAREPYRAAATVAAGIERDNARAKHRRGSGAIRSRANSVKARAKVQSRIGWSGMSIIAPLAKPIEFRRTGWAIPQSASGAGGAGTISTLM
jgi:hypothetical protein